MMTPNVSLTLSLIDAQQLKGTIQDALESTTKDIHDYDAFESNINDLHCWKEYAAFLSRTLQDVSQRVDYSQGRTPPSTHLASSSRELINKALTHLDLRQYQLAELLGVSGGQISKWKRNEYMAVSRQTMIKELL